MAIETMTNSEENHETIQHNTGAIQALHSLVKMLEERVTMLETSIVQLCNEEEPDVDWAEIGQQQRDNEEGYNDR